MVGCNIVIYRVVQKKGTVLLSNSLAWPAVAGSSRAETFSQLSSISFAQPCTWRGEASRITVGRSRVGHILLAFFPGKEIMIHTCVYYKAVLILPTEQILWAGSSLEIGNR